MNLSQELKNLSIEDDSNFKCPDNLKKYSDMQELFKEYEKKVTEAVCILICNYSTLNMATEMDFAKINRKVVQ